MQALANINGNISTLEEAKISITDRGFLYGDSVYEVLRTYNGIPFYEKEHFDRLENSARLALMVPSQSRKFLQEEIRKTVQAAAPAGNEDVFVRYTITRGSGPLDLDPSTAINTNYVILVKAIHQWNPRYYSEGVRLAIPPTRRNSPLALDPNIKSGNYLNNIIAVAEAKKLGADDALFLSIEGKLTEASNSNITLIINGELHSPLHETGTSTGNLNGITQNIIKKLATKVGLSSINRPLAVDDIKNAQECIVSSATREVMPVSEIQLEDGGIHKFPAGGGQVTKKLQKAYQEHIEEYKILFQKNAYFSWMK